MNENENGRVRVTHPDLKGAEAWVLPDAVAVHELSGWKADSKAPAASTEKKVS